MTRPRRRKNADGLSGFSVVDPGGNWIRIFPAGEAAADTEPRSKLRVALDNAAVQGDSRGDHVQAAKILDGALARGTDAPATDRVETLAYRVELDRHRTHTGDRDSRSPHRPDLTPRVQPRGPVSPTNRA